MRLGPKLGTPVMEPAVGVEAVTVAVDIDDSPEPDEDEFDTLRILRLEDRRWSYLPVTVIFCLVMCFAFAASLYFAIVALVRHFMFVVICSHLCLLEQWSHLSDVLPPLPSNEYLAIMSFYLPASLVFSALLLVLLFAVPMVWPGPLRYACKSCCFGVALVPLVCL